MKVDIVYSKVYFIVNNNNSQQNVQEVFAFAMRRTKRAVPEISGNIENRSVQLVHKLISQKWLV